MADAQRGVNLKDEEEVKDYLERLGVEYRFGCYYEKDGKACDLLGSYMDQIMRDPKKAFKLYQTACNEYNFGRSCSKLGGYYFAGKSCERDVDKAYESWRKGCDAANAPDAKACFNAALLDNLDPDTKIGGLQGFKNSEKFYKRSTEPDKLKAIELYKRSCDMTMNPMGEGCNRYASFLLAGMDGVEKDPAKALPYCVKACDMGVFEGCVNASIIFQNGDGVKKNERFARIYKNMAQDIKNQYTENRERVRFQEGAESGTEVPLWNNMIIHIVVKFPA